MREEEPPKRIDENLWKMREESEILEETITKSVRIQHSCIILCSLIGHLSEAETCGLIYAGGERADNLHGDYQLSADANC